MIRPPMPPEVVAPTTTMLSGFNSGLGGAAYPLNKFSWGGSSSFWIKERLGHNGCFLHDPIPFQIFLIVDLGNDLSLSLFQGSCNDAYAIFAFALGENIAEVTVPIFLLA
ncbi:MAG: hypothetical protein Ct9H90mP13_06340 [Pseudomonadota bacterium]|nr:MAG: hypothetical protein Ct9H90mP13_06340 [Pseudomonadota bacterium]